jgi:hypothetical protein
VLYASASGGDHTVAIDDSSWPGMRYWGWNLGLQQATVDGRELFVNLVADAIGQP